MNMIKRTIDIKEKFKIVKIYVQSQWRVVLLWYIFWQSSIQRGRHTQLCIITSLKWNIQICSNFYCWISKLLSIHPIHIVVWGNFPFKTFKRSSHISECIMSHSSQTITCNTFQGWAKFSHILPMGPINDLREMLVNVNVLSSRSILLLVLLLKALFNNVFTVKNLNCMSLPYMISVSLISCKNEALKKIAPQKHH